MQTQATTATPHPGGPSREELLRQARNLRALTAHPVRMALLHPNGTTRYQDAGFLREVVAYLQPILKVVLQSREIELASPSPATAPGEVSLRFVLRPDGSLVKYDQANNSDTASPVEFLHEPEDLDAVLARLSRAFMSEESPLGLASADEIRMIREALGASGQLVES